MKNFLLGLLFLNGIILVNAQNPCGTQWDSQWAEEMLLKDRSYLDLPRGTRATIYVPIHYHIVTKNDGTGGFPMTYLLQLHCELNERYVPSDIQFIFDTFSTIKNTNLYAYASSSQAGDNATFNTYNTLNHCNVYLVDDPAGNCGYTYRPQTGGIQKRGGIFVKASRTSTTCSGPGSTTLTHEMGHWLDLPHTFYGWENIAAPNPANPAPAKPAAWSTTERVARTAPNMNCATSGDFLCGTPPDYISSRWSNCNATSSFANYKDPLNVAFTIEAANYMSYSSDICANKFSADQTNQMRNCFLTKADRIPYLSVPIPQYVDLDSINYVAPLNGNKQPRNNVNLVWNKVDKSELYHLIVIKGGTTLNNKPNFDILGNIVLDTMISDTSFLMNSNIFATTVNGSNAFYYWKARPMRKGNNCEDYGVVSNFKVAVFNVDYSYSNVSCKGKSDGKILMRIFGGVSPSFTIESDLLSTMVDSNYNLAPGIYNMVIKGVDPLDFVNFPIEIKEPEPIKINITVNGNTVTAIGEGGNGLYNYKWSNGETTNSIQYNAQNTYNVTVTDNNGCSANKTVGNSGINIIMLEAEDFKVYPNPISNEANFSIEIFTSNETSAIIDLVDLKGNMIKEWDVKLTEGKNKITNSLDNIASGMYLLSIKSNSFIGFKRVIVK